MGTDSDNKPGTWISEGAGSPPMIGWDLSKQQPHNGLSNGEHSTKFGNLLPLNWKCDLKLQILLGRGLSS